MSVPTSYSVEIFPAFLELNFNGKPVILPFPTCSLLKGRQACQVMEKSQLLPLSAVVTATSCGTTKQIGKEEMSDRSLPMRTASALTIVQYTALSPFWPVVLSVKESFCLNHWYKTLKQNETRQIRKKKSMLFPKITLQVDQI